MNLLEETKQICLAETRHALSSGRLWSLFALYLLFSTFSGVAVHGCSRLVTRSLDTQSEALAQNGEAPAANLSLQEGRRAFIKFFFSNDDEELAQSLENFPLPLLFLFELGLFFLPVFIALLGFDQISSETGPRTLRFLTVRVRREAIVLSRLLSQGLLVWACVGGLLLLQLLYGFFIAPEVGLFEGLLWAGRLGLKAVLFCLPYLALTSLCSTLTRSSAGSLFLNLFCLLALWLLVALDGFADAEWTHGLSYVSVWRYRTNLLHPHLLTLLGAALAHLVFAAVYVAAGLYQINTRDV